ncbi:unnamed protein product, partial [marine sediment metagenome]
MKKYILTVVLLALCGGLFAETPLVVPKWGRDGDAIYNKKGDSLFLYLIDGSDTSIIWFSSHGIYWESATIFDSILFDSIHDGLGRFSGDGNGNGHWAFRDSTTIVYVNDSTGDTNVFIQDTTGFRGLRVSGIITDTLTVNDYMKVPSIYGDEIGIYKIRMYDTVAFKRRPY